MKKLTGFHLILNMADLENGWKVQRIGPFPEIGFGGLLFQFGKMISPENAFALAMATGGDGPEDYVPHLPDYVAKANGL